MILRLKEIELTSPEPTNYGDCLLFKTADERFFKFMNWLSAEELTKINRKKNPDARLESIAARVLAKSIFVHRYYLKPVTDYQKIAILNQSDGKQLGAPEIFFEKHKLPLHVAITHSCGLVGVWLCSYPISIDIEHIFHNKESSFIRDVFSEAEINRLTHASQIENIEEGLTILWCLKEALVKLFKCGLNFKTKSIQVLMNENQTVDLYLSHELKEYFYLFEKQSLKVNITVKKGVCCCKMILL